MPSVFQTPGALLLLALAAAPLAAQSVKGRVVDEKTRQAIASATVTLRAASGEVVAHDLSDRGGYFKLSAHAAGDYTIVVEPLGYAPAQRAVSLSPHQELVVPAFVLAAQAIPLDSISARGERAPDQRAAVGFTRSSMVLAAGRMAMLERQGATLMTAIRELSGVRIREFMTAGGQKVTCVEALLRFRSITGDERYCEPVVFVVDGVQIGSSDYLLRNMNLTDYESVEFLPPAEAGQRYGLEASSHGAVVLWTRGRGPHVDPERNGR